MPKKTANNPGTLESLVEIAAVYRPMIQHAVNGLKPQQRSALRERVLRAEQILSDRKLAEEQRLVQARSQLQELFSVATPSKVTDLGVRSLRVLLGLALEILSTAEKAKNQVA